MESRHWRRLSGWTDNYTRHMWLWGLVNFPSSMPLKSCHYCIWSCDLEYEKLRTTVYRNARFADLIWIVKVSLILQDFWIQPWFLSWWQDDAVIFENPLRRKFWHRFISLHHLQWFVFQALTKLRIFMESYPLKNHPKRSWKLNRS